MKVTPQVHEASSQPDVDILKRLFLVRDLFLGVAGMVSLVVLGGWVFPVVGKALPEGWTLMKANTAFCILLSTVALLIIRSGPGRIKCRFSKVLALIIIVLTGSALLGHFSGRSFWLDTWITPDSGAEMPGRMSIQTGLFFFLTGMTLLLNGMKENRGNLVLDCLVVMEGAIAVIVFTGYMFAALNLFGQSLQTRTSPHTLLSMILIVFSVAVLRIDSGIFSVFAGIGIGSHFARIALPASMFATFLTIGVGASSVLLGWAAVRYAAALTMTASLLLLFIIILVTSRKINTLDMKLRQMSLVDELTGIQNRRGFFLLGEHMYREGLRYGIPLTILFFDLDGLKVVNDTYGHDAGSGLIRDFAGLLSTTFRKSDIIARLGGDEFAVVTRETELGPALSRLEGVVNDANQSGANPYLINYSVGEASAEAGSGMVSFADLVNQADMLMYERKREKKASRESESVNRSPGI